MIRGCYRAAIRDSGVQNARILACCSGVKDSRFRASASNSRQVQLDRMIPGPSSRWPISRVITPPITTGFVGPEGCAGVLGGPYIHVREVAATILREEGIASEEKARADLGSLSVIKRMTNACCPAVCSQLV